MEFQAWLSSIAELKKEVGTLDEEHPDTFAVVWFKPFECEPKHQPGQPPLLLAESLEPKPSHLSCLVPQLDPTLLDFKTGATHQSSAPQPVGLHGGFSDQGDWLAFFYGDSAGCKPFLGVNNVVTRLLSHAAKNGFRTLTTLPGGFDDETIWLRLLVQWSTLSHPALPMVVSRFAPNGKSESLRLLGPEEDDNATIWYTSGIRVFEASRYGLAALETTASTNTTTEPRRQTTDPSLLPKPDLQSRDDLDRWLATWIEEMDDYESLGCIFALDSAVGWIVDALGCLLGDKQRINRIGKHLFQPAGIVAVLYGEDRLDREELWRSVYRARERIDDLIHSGVDVFIYPRLGVPAGQFTTKLRGLVEQACWDCFNESCPAAVVKECRAGLARQLQQLRLSFRRSVWSRVSKLMQPLWMPTESRLPIQKASQATKGSSFQQMTTWPKFSAFPNAGCERRPMLSASPVCEPANNTCLRRTPSKTL